MRKLFLIPFLFYTMTALGSAAIQDGSVTPPKLDARTSTPNWNMDCGLATSVATNAMTVTLKTAVGGTPTALSPCIIAFRNGTALTGQYAMVKTTAALSMVITSGATLGLTSAVASYIWVYALNDAGVVDLCVTGGNPVDEMSIQPAIQISAGASLATTLYCGLAHTGSKPVRLIGRLNNTQTVAGTYAANVTEIALNPVLTRAETSYNTAAATGALLACAGGVKGTGTVVDTYSTRRDGQFMWVKILYSHTVAGTACTGEIKFTIPNSLLINTTITGVNTTATGSITAQFAALQPITSCANISLNVSNATGGCGFATVFDTSHVRFWISVLGVGPGFWGVTQNNWSNSAVSAAIEFQAPIQGWFDYGP